MGEDPAPFTERLHAALQEARPDTHTVLLSSEGLFHRWWDFSPAGLEALHLLAVRAELELWAFFREPVAFTRSFYVQMLKNPRGLGPCYGLDASIDALLDEPRFSLHLDYIGYIRTVEAVLGAGKVRPFRYTGNTVANMLEALGITDLAPDMPPENRSVGEWGVSLLRQINQRTLGVDEKWQAVSLIEKLDRLADGYRRPLQLAPETIQRIHTLSAESVAAFARLYNLDIS